MPQSPRPYQPLHGALVIGQIQAPMAPWRSRLRRLVPGQKLLFLRVQAKFFRRKI
jgi:hypothetical protein